MSQLIRGILWVVQQGVGMYPCEHFKQHFKNKNNITDIASDV